MLNIFGTLSGTLNNTKPASDMGILFKEPTKLQEQEDAVRHRLIATL